MKKKGLLLKIIVFILCITAYAYLYSYSQDDALFVYENEGRRDPFVALVSKEGKLEVSYGIINSINDVILEGILYDPKGESAVVLNDILLKENDQIGNIKVKKIFQDRVILYFMDNEYVFKLKE
jgi:hypothetical protein